MIDIDKFIASLLQWGHLGIPKDAICFALKEQGLEFRDGSIKDILEDTVVDSNEDGLIADTIKQGEQKHEWSEEDEERQEETIELLETLIDHPKFRNYATTRCVDWLKSLRPQKQWKPTEEQMITLEYYMHTLISNKHKEVLFGLIEQLKAL